MQMPIWRANTVAFDVCIIKCWLLLVLMEMMFAYDPRNKKFGQLTFAGDARGTSPVCWQALFQQHCSQKWAIARFRHAVQLSPSSNRKQRIPKSRSHVATPNRASQPGLNWSVVSELACLVKPLARLSLIQAAVSSDPGVTPSFIPPFLTLQSLFEEKTKGHFEFPLRGTSLPFVSKRTSHFVTDLKQNKWISKRSEAQQKLSRRLL